MACTNKNCGCGYGTLNTVAGPLINCGCGCTNPQYYQNFPFYNGPCGCVDCKNQSSSWRRHHPWHWWNSCGNGCGCSNQSSWNHCSCGSGSSQWNHCGWNPWNGCAHVNVGDCSAAASFGANASMMVEAGGTIPLTAEICSADYEVCNDGSILIHRPGTYMAIYSLHVPALQSLSTQMFLSLNGTPLEGSAQDVSRIADGTTGGSSRHSLFRAWPNSELRLISTQSISVTEPQDCTNVFSLTLIRLG